MRNAAELLHKLTDRFPPSLYRRHAITLSDDPSRGVVRLTLSVGEHWQDVYFEEDDLGKPVDTIVDEIRALLGK